MEELIEWVEEKFGMSIVSDDDGRWACTTDGFQNVPESDGAFDLSTSFFIKKDQFRNSIREAIELAMEEE